MEGYLWKQGHIVKNWQLRYFRLNPSLQLLEYYENHHWDAKRCGAVQLAGAQVDLGENIGTLGEGIASAADKRRFVFRIIDGISHKPYFICAQVKEGTEASRDNLNAWVSALGNCSSTSTPTTASVTPVKTNQLAFTAAVTRVNVIEKEEVLEISCQASIVIQTNVGLEECTCKWTLWRHYAEFTALDKQLRYIFETSMKSIALPQLRVVDSSLFHLFKPAHDDNAFVSAFDAYLQKILAMEEIINFELEGSKLVLEFVEYPQHVAQLPTPPSTAKQSPSPKHHHHAANPPEKPKDKLQEELKERMVEKHLLNN